MRESVLLGKEIVVPQQREKWWTGQRISFAVGVVAWLVADNVFHYRSILGLYFLACLGLMWFVAPGFESFVKRLSLEAVLEALAATDDESATSAVSSSLKELRAGLRAELNLDHPNFLPYSVSIFVNSDNLPELLQKVGFIDRQQWINGAKWDEAKPHEIIHDGFQFVVLSSDQRGNPCLVYRSDGDTPHFLTGLAELSRTLADITFEEKESGVLGDAFALLIGPRHPRLCFGRLLRGSGEHDTYQLAIEVDEGWWDRISDKPEVECHKVYKSTPDEPTKSVYLILARIPRWAIHAEDPEKRTEESSRNQRKAQLEELGWTHCEDDLGLDHKFFYFARNDLSGNSSVGGRT